MLSGILVFTGAMLIGYFLGVRKTGSDRKRTSNSAGFKGRRQPQTLNEFIAKNAYILGFLFIASGSLLQLIHLELSLFNSMNDFVQIVIIIAAALLLFFICKKIVDQLGKKQFKNAGGIHPNHL